MVFASNNCILLSNQDANWFFCVGDDWTSDFLFDDKRLYMQKRKLII